MDEEAGSLPYLRTVLFIPAVTRETQLKQSAALPSGTPTPPTFLYPLREFSTLPVSSVVKTGLQATTLSYLLLNFLLFLLDVDILN